MDWAGAALDIHDPVTGEIRKAYLFVAVLPCSCYELENAMHVYELPRPHYTWVRILGCQMGIGGDDSWGAPVQQRYRLPSDVDRTVKFTIRKVSSTADECGIFMSCGGANI